MGSDIGKGGICGQITLIVLNILFIILGIIAVAIGAWAIASGSTFSFLTGNQIIGGSAILIITGSVIIIIAAVGILGALCKIRVILVIYALVVLAVVIAEIVVGIVAIVYRNEVADIIQGGVEENLIRNYNASNPSSDQNRIVNFVQSTFMCCGFTNASDWARFNVPAIIENMGQPPFCSSCDATADNCETYDYIVMLPLLNQTRSFNATTVGCGSVNTQALLGAAIGAGVVALIFGLLEISGIIIALLLCCCIQRARQQTVV